MPLGEILPLTIICVLLTMTSLRRCSNFRLHFFTVSDKTLKQLVLSYKIYNYYTINSGCVHNHRRQQLKKINGNGIVNFTKKFSSWYSNIISLNS